MEKYFLGTSIITQFVKWALKLGGLPGGLEYKAPDAAAVTLDPERLHVGRRTLALRWLTLCKRKGNKCDQVGVSFHFQHIGC